MIQQFTKFNLDEWDRTPWWQSRREDLGVETFLNTFTVLTEFVLIIDFLSFMNNWNYLITQHGWP